MEPMIEATRSDLIRAFKEWAAQAEAENWPVEPDPQVNAEVSADELIRRLNIIQKEG